MATGELRLVESQCGAERTVGETEREVAHGEILPVRELHIQEGEVRGENHGPDRRRGYLVSSCVSELDAPPPGWQRLPRHGFAPQLLLEETKVQVT